jgi:2-methylcitrate dehydratase PrpD
MATADTHALRLGRFVTEFSLDDAPDDVVTHAEHLVLDSLGVMLGGTRLEQAQIVTEFWAEQGGTPAATVPGASERLPLPTAAYLNCYLANLLDYDDTYSGRAIGHPGATVVPAAVAVAEATGADTRSLLEAVLVGYECSIRVGDAIMPTPERSAQVVGTGTWQIFGPAAAAAKLLDCDAEQVADALGMAGMNAPVPLVRKVGIASPGFQWLKNNYGWAAMGGVVAAELAARGFLGSRDIFDGPTGFWRMAASDSFDEAVLHRDLDEWWAVRDVSFKPYSSCRWTHAALDCVLDLRERVEPDEIRSIRVDTFREGAALDSVPDTVFEAQFSLPFVVAVALLGYEPGFEWLSADRVEDPEVAALVERVETHADPEMTAWYEADGQMAAAVTIQTTAGEDLTARTDDPRGDPAKQLSYDAVRTKFHQLADPLLGESAADAVEATALSLTEARPINSLTDPLAQTPTPAAD